MSFELFVTRQQAAHVPRDAQRLSHNNLEPNARWGVLLITVNTQTGTSGFEDGPASEARLGLLSGVAVYPRQCGGGVVVADWTNNRIRRIAVDGTVVTIAGSGKGGCRDGQGDAAQFNNPTAVAVTSQGEMFVRCAPHPFTLQAMHCQLCVPQPCLPT